jgi:hypothetical protein
MRLEQWIVAGETPNALYYRCAGAPRTREDYPVSRASQTFNRAAAGNDGTKCIRTLALNQLGDVDERFGR